MRSIIKALLASLLLTIFLIFLSNEAQGIRLGNSSMMMKLEKALIEEESDLVVEESFRKINLYINGHANSGNNRKLLTSTSPSSSSPTSSTTSSKNEEEGNKKGNSDQNLETGIEHYPDLIDIAEMDYSPATRKPPIHN